MAYINSLEGLFDTATNNGIKHAERYLCGLMQVRSAGGKNMERMEEAVPELDYQGVQHFMADSPWDWRLAVSHAALGVDALLGGRPESQLIIDETAFSKKGTKSVGVARQYNGRLGKVDNAQVAVFAAMSCGDRASLTGVRLYLPEEWCNDRKRCDDAGIPEADRQFKSKCQLALALIEEQRALGMRFRWVALDAGYGKDPAFLRALDDTGEVFVADIHSNQMIWLENPWPAPAQAIGRARVGKRLHPSTKPMKVGDWARQQSSDEWRPLVLRQGTKGELRLEFLHARVYLWDREEEIPRLWHLIVRRTLSEGGEVQDVSYTLSNAPAETAPTQIVKQACGRHFIERSFQDAKSQVGMGDYQLRGWLGWHHHMALVTLAMLFLLQERMLHVESLPLLSCADVAELLACFLPKRAVTHAEVLAQLTRRHYKRQRDIESARRRQPPQTVIHEI